MKPIIRHLEWAGNSDTERCRDYMISPSYGQGPKPWMLSRGSKLLGWYDEKWLAKVAAHGDNEAYIYASIDFPEYVRTALDAEKTRAEAARVYIASKALHGPKWVQLRDAGLPIISTWIDESGVGETINWPGLWSRCISEASDCTHLIAYRELGEILKGAWAEVGAALAHGRKVILCGDFTEFSIKHHPNVTIWASSDIRTALRAITEASHE